MSRVIFLIVLCCLFVTANPLRAHNAWVVSSPQQLQFVDLADGYQYLTKQFTKRFDILNAIRRAAGRQIAKGWGLQKMPDKATVEIGAIADVSAGALQFAVVLRGERLDTKLLQSRLLEKYGNHWRRHKVPTRLKETTIAGATATIAPYMERTGEIVTVIVEDHLIVASVLPNTYSLIEETIAVIREPSQRSTTAPEKVHLTYHGYLTKEERRRIAEFFNRTITGEIKHVRKSFASLYDGIDADDDFDPDTFKTTNEQINELFLTLESWAADLTYTKGDSADTDVYEVAYNLVLPTAADAQRMKEMVLEKILFYKENARNRATVFALDSIALDVADNVVTVAAEIDTKAGQYNYFFAYVAFLLSYTQTDRYLEID